MQIVPAIGTADKQDPQQKLHMKPNFASELVGQLQEIAFRADFKEGCPDKKRVH